MVQLKNRWGDLLEDEEELPPTTVTGPDAKGIIVRTEYVRNDKGDVIKKTTRTKVVQIEKRVYQVRWGWVKVADAAGCVRVRGESRAGRQALVSVQGSVKGGLRRNRPLVNVWRRPLMDDKDRKRPFHTSHLAPLHSSPERHRPTGELDKVWRRRAGARVRLDHEPRDGGHPL